jgi:GNAT superfamily N-acetyltransferase
MQVKYRRPLAADAVCLAKVARDTFVVTFGHLYPDEDLQPFLRESYDVTKTAEDILDAANFILLAEVEGVLVGYVHAGKMGLPFETGVRTAREIKRLYVTESAKGTGIAQALMDAATIWAKGECAEDLYLGVFSQNARAIAFYARNGFAIVGAYLFMVGKTADDERIMVKQLT